MEKSKNVLFQKVIGQLERWTEWRDNYHHFVPLFIEESKTKKKWQDWDTDVFNEFFERSSGQCVSSMQQGYFSSTEREQIKGNWEQIAPLLKRIAEQQDEPDFNTYYELKGVIRTFTSVDRRAATNRLIASLQPKLLSTMVNERYLYELFDYLSCHTGVDLEYVGGDWFRNSYSLWQFYQEQLSDRTYWDIMTFPWETYTYFKHGGKVPDEVEDMSEDAIYGEIFNLLEEKHQVILQGAPGTGKTFVAKQVAKMLAGPGKLVKPDRIGRETVERLLHVGDKIKSVSKHTEYTIESMKDGRIVVSGPDMTTNKEMGIDKVVTAYQGKKWEPKKIVNGLDSYEAALAHAVYERVECVVEDHTRGKRVRLVQFHPAYTYEDFVRGISVEAGEEGLEYRACDQILGSLAKEAWKNWEDSQKDVDEVSKERWLDEQFDEFVDFIGEKLEQSNKGFPLTEHVKVSAVEPEAFRYKGNDWKNRMLFCDLKRAFLDGNESRQDIKRNSNLSGLARWHSSYYVRMLGAFKDYLKEHSIQFISKKVKKVGLQKYVLIVDEINRANLPAVLGELIYALEYRGESVDCMYAVNDDRRLVLPPNLYVIGTMNTADRSVGQVDYAIRRRFAFVDVLPKVLQGVEGFDTELFKKVSELFIENVEGYIKGLDEGTDVQLKRSGYLSEDFRPEDVWLGHSYFIMKDCRRDTRIRYEIKPLLKEYVRDGVLKDKDNSYPVMDFINRL